jgi:hypothetical protein
MVLDIFVLQMLKIWMKGIVLSSAVVESILGTSGHVPCVCRFWLVVIYRSVEDIREEGSDCHVTNSRIDEEC